MSKKTILVLVAIVAIAVSGVSALLLNNHPSVASSSSSYRWVVKFEQIYERQPIPYHWFGAPEIETQVSTHINIYNPNAFPVNLTKRFVCVRPENETPDGRTEWVWHQVPANKGFEIDWEDILRWPPDPGNPYTPTPCKIKGFVIIECPFNLTVVAVYNKKTVDVINKITFHIRWDPGPIYTPKGTFEFNRPYAINVPYIDPQVEAARSLDNGSYLLAIDDGQRIGQLLVNYTKGDVEIEIVSATTFFDFLTCAPKNAIVFILRPTNRLWERYWNKTFGMPAPWPICVPLEICVKDTMNETLGATPKNRIPSGMLEQDLAKRGIPDAIIYGEIMPYLRIEIIEFDVAEGVGTGIDVEYIEPETI